MFKIANTCLSKSWGGLEMSALRWARNLTGRGHEVTTIVPESSRLSHEIKQAGLTQVTVPCMTKYFDPRAALKIRSFLKRHEIEIIQAHHSKDLWMLYPAVLGLSRPRLFYVSRILFRGTTKRDVFHTLVYKRLAGVITLTEIGKHCFVNRTKVPPGRVRVIPNGFDVDAYDLPAAARSEVRRELGMGDDELAVGCTSRIDPQKAQYELIQAVRTVVPRFEKIKLLVVGEPTFGEGQPYLDFLKRKTVEYGMDDVVTFTGFRADIPRLLRALDIFVMPTYEETFGNCLVEAMLAGLPCIGTDSGGTPEVLEGGRLGLLVEPRSVDSLARAIQTLAENERIRADLGGRARASARERFNLDGILMRIEDFYRSAQSGIASSLRSSQ
jgi:glycosyltransferase involved in cell wall biosynthesis